MQLIVADLDGSIIHNNKISTFDIQSIAYWISKGNSFTISTGRPFSRTIKIIDELKIILPVILCNGAAIYTKNKTIDILKHINVEDAKSLLDSLTEKQILKNCIIYCGDKTQLLCADQELICKVSDWDIDYDCITNIKEITNDAILMISFYNPIYEVENYVRQLSGSYNIECLFGNYIDILPMGISKGKALKKILKNYRFDEIFIIGDSINDLSMIFGSNKLIAVENAVKEIKDKAYKTIASNKDNPVKDLIDKIRRNEYGNI